MITITSFFSHIGIPSLGLSPTIRIWDILPSGNVLIIDDELCTEIGDGFYFYNFSGHDETHNYVVRVDGGSPPLFDGERYNIASITPDTQITINNNTIQQIATSVWDENTSSHMDDGTFGMMLNMVKADTTSININIISAVDLLNTLLKYERNRTKIDKNNKTLTVYDDDNVTPIKIFQLKDSNGVESVTEVCERLPQ